MRDDALRLLWMDSARGPGALSPSPLDSGGFGRFAVKPCATLEAASNLLGERSFDAVLLCVGELELQRLSHWPGLAQATPDAAVLVLPVIACEAKLALSLLHAGVQDVLSPPADTSEVARALFLAVERKRIERAARKAYATDLRTGLPNRQQLIEHMSQLLALRGREPAPMALLVMRVEGFATVESAFGRESANVLRRKVAVRLRAAVRASDVVAALAADSFALLLASTEEPLDAERVARKLLVALHEPFTLSGQQVAVAASAGVSRFPADGVDADVLMRQAIAASVAAQAVGRDGFVNWRESVWHDTGAANDGDIGER